MVPRIERAGTLYPAEMAVGLDDDQQGLVVTACTQSSELDPLYSGDDKRCIWRQLARFLIERIDFADLWKIDLHGGADLYDRLRSPQQQYSARYALTDSTL